LRTVVLQSESAASVLASVNSHVRRLPSGRVLSRERTATRALLAAICRHQNLHHQRAVARHRTCPRIGQCGWDRRL